MFTVRNLSLQLFNLDEQPHGIMWIARYRRRFRGSHESGTIITVEVTTEFDLIDGYLLP